MRPETLRPSSNERICVPVLMVDDWTVSFGDNSWESASNRTIPLPVNNCGNVDSLWVVEDEVTARAASTPSVMA
jgi:hypothetical protein